MRKYLIIFVILILTLSLISCGTTDSNNDDNLQYTKEFPYLPNYKNMEFVTLEKATDDGMDRATYKVTNTTPEEFLSGYEEHLTKEGWKNTLDNKPVSINMEKENHKAIITVPSSEGNGDITVFIFSE
jgi:hypothetical protein